MLGKADLGCVAKSGAVLLPFSQGERVSLFSGLPSPEGRVLGAWSPRVHQEPSITGAPPGAAGDDRWRGRQEPGS